MFVVLGIQVVHGPSSPVEVVDIAAVAIDVAGREMGAFESVVNPGRIPISSECLGKLGRSLDELRAGPSAENAAEGLRAFLNAHPKMPILAYNIDRAKKLLSNMPWKITEGWGECIRQKLLNLIGDLDDGDFKLYDAAYALKIPVTCTRHALTDARISAEIIGKMERRMHNVSDVDFLREAEYIMENGL